MKISFLFYTRAYEANAETRSNQANG